MTDEVRLRFIAAIAKQLPAPRVAELHLFPAIRQGGVESGVAVIALERELPITIDVDGGYVPPADVAEAEAIETHEAVATNDELSDEAAFMADDVLQADDSDSPYKIGEADPSATPQDDKSSVSKSYTVYSAFYRHTLKGPDRGKWEVSITEEADAPLVTVDAVVRGVQRRSGDLDESFRMSGDEFRAALPPTAA